MWKVEVVEVRICRGSGGFGRGVELFVGFGLPLGYGVFFALRVLPFFDMSPANWDKMAYLI